MKRLFSSALYSVSFAALVATAASGQAAAQDVSSLPAYQPGQTVSGTIRLSGDKYMSAVTKNWAEGFHKFHPEVNFETQLLGSDTAMPPLYFGKSDIALIGREANLTETNGFLRIYQYQAQPLELMTGSLDVPGKTYALTIFVHKDNPLAKLTMAEVGAIFGCERGCGLDNIRRWGQLGLTGNWKDLPINLYGYDIETGTGQFFMLAALADSRKLYWDRMTEFKDIRNADGSIYESGQQIVDALRRDPYGIAVSNVRYRNPDVKVIALAAKAGGEYFEPTKENIVSRKYPLVRRTFAFVNQPPDKPVEPKVKEFLRYVLSREGQLDILREGQYLPLSPETVREQLAKLR